MNTPSFEEFSQNRKQFEDKIEVNKFFFLIRINLNY